MPNAKEELAKIMNQSLALEHAARVQYLAHAEVVSGLNAEPIIARLREIAGDEEKHEGKFRTIIGDYLGAEPTMSMAETHRATQISEILETNLKIEKSSIDLYKKAYRMIIDRKEELQYEFEAIEHLLRHIIMDEQEHVSELKRLMGT